MLRLGLCVPKISSTLCDQVIFVDQTTDTSLLSDAVLVKINWLGQGFQRRGCAQSAVGAVLIVVGLVLGEDPPQVGLVPDEGAVQEFAAASADPAFGDGVGPHRQLHPFQMIDTVGHG
jgi:hypothetical protein